MKIKNGFVVRAVGDEHIAVPIGERAKEFHGMIKLNATAVFLWDFFKNDRTAEDAVKALTSEYDVSEEEAKKGVESFVSLIKENNFAE